MHATCDPEFAPLLKGFDTEAIDRHSSSVYGLWPNLSLAYVNPAWFRFAADNNGEPAISTHWSIGAAFMDAIPDPLRDFYTRLFSATLAGSSQTDPSPVRHEYECSSAAVYRRFLMTVYPLRSGSGLLVVNTLTVECAHDQAERPPQLANTASYTGNDGIVRQCAHCRRIQVPANPDLWHWVPAWVDKCPLQVSHTLCNFCLDHYYPE
jgi:hypothetical protein